ncbi:MAG: gamma-glutamyl-gamma-aminobutyrate hydrolase family protein [Chloroflexi bacterium]|nr:gamma-glutamyl-gamma-aminobutyrate hydrolase family protein [Chloroflexota bacterium]
MRPLIGITCSSDQQTSRFSLARNYIAAVEIAGGAPIIIPYPSDPVILHDVHEKLDGLLLSGGGDVAPHRYGTTDSGHLIEVDEQRDEAEWQLARWALEDNRPLLAICRGIQVLNVALGGTLYQDLSVEYPGALQHRCAPHCPRDHTAHTVSVVQGTLTARLLGVKPDQVVPVNSFHHQSVKDVATGLIVTARAPDGVVEGLESPAHRFVIGVQWHPEEMLSQAAMRRLFIGFVEACRT